MFSQDLLFFEFTAPEVMLIFFVILLLFGGDKLPALAKSLGKGIRDFKEASDGVKKGISSQLEVFENKKAEEPVNSHIVINDSFKKEHPDSGKETHEIIQYCNNVNDAE